jgi:hypothetical protein
VLAQQNGGNDDVIAELKTLHQKIDGNAAALAGRVGDLEQRLSSRADIQDAQIAELRAANPVTATTDVNNDIARAQQEMQRLQQELADLGAIRTLPDAAAPAEPAPTMTPEQIEAQAAQQQRAQTQLLENTLVAEARDPEWSIDAEEKVRAGLGAVRGELTVNDLVCANTLCKLEVSSTGSDAAAVFRTMNEHLSWDGEMFVTINLDEGHTTAWLGRPGASLPRANAAGN